MVDLCSLPNISDELSQPRLAPVCTAQPPPPPRQNLLGLLASVRPLGRLGRIRTPPILREKTHSPAHRPHHFARHAGERGRAAAGSFPCSLRRLVSSSPKRPFCGSATVPWDENSFPRFLPPPAKAKKVKRTLPLATTFGSELNVAALPL